MNDNLTTLEIISGIAQVVSNRGYDGALDDDGEPIKIGLKREEGHPINDSRVTDGFKVTFQANKMKISYHSEIKLEDVHDKNFESDLDSMIESIASFIKKEYKKLTRKTLGLKRDSKEVKARVETTSRVRAFVTAYMWYELTALPGSEELSKDETQDKLDKALKDWMSHKAPVYKNSVKDKKKDSDKFMPWNYSNKNTSR